MSDRPRVVVAVDVQTHPVPLCEAAARVAALAGAEATLLYVVQLPQGVTPDLQVRGPAGPTSAFELVRAEVLERFATYAPIFDAAGASASFAVRTGGVVDGIWATARELDAELVIVGSDLVKGLRRLLSKSFTEAVLHEASCPVVVVKTEGETAPAGPLASMGQLLAENNG